MNANVLRAVFGTVMAMLALTSCDEVAPADDCEGATPRAFARIDTLYGTRHIATEDTPIGLFYLSQASSADGQKGCAVSLEIENLRSCQLSVLYEIHFQNGRDEWVHFGNVWMPAHGHADEGVIEEQAPRIDRSDVWIGASIGSCP